MKKIVLPLLATVLMLFTVGTADAQLGKLFNKAKDAVSGNSASKKSYAEISKPVIPQPEAGAEKIIFTWEKTSIGWWDPAALELIFNQKYDEGELAGQYVTFKLDPATGKFTSNAGSDKGSISNDGTIVSPNLGTLTFKQEISGVIIENYVYKGDKLIGRVSTDKAWCKGNDLIGGLYGDVSPLLVAYIYFGSLLSENQINTWAAEYDAKQAEAAKAAAERQSSSSSSSSQNVRMYEVTKGYSSVGYVDENGVVYDRYKSKIGQLPKGNGDILNSSGSRIGEIYSDKILKSGKVLCQVSGSSLLIEKPGSSSMMDFGTVSGEVYAGKSPSEPSSRSKIGSCDCGNKLWTAALVFCDFFFN
jgi:hypothetical protein